MLIEYTLMHRNTEVADISLDHGYLTTIDAVHDERHAPVGTMNIAGRLGSFELRFWLQRRQIPFTRTDAADELYRLGFANPGSALEASLACSLSDTYWLRPKGADVTWSDINLFENDFSKHTISFRQRVPSADASTAGDQPKRWVISEDGTRLLVKQASPLFPQQVANEIIGSKFAEELGIGHVPYWLSSDHTSSICPTMADERTDYVCAYDILQQQRFPTAALDNDLIYLRNQFEEHGLDFDRAISDMSLVDVTMRNEDRHWTNFGILRDAETLQWKGVAPLFDFGNSLWFNPATQSGEPTSKMSGRVLLSDFGYFQDITQRQIDAIEHFPEIVEDVLSTCKAPQEHLDFVSGALPYRIGRITQAARVKQRKEPSPCKQNSTTLSTGCGKKSDKTSTSPSPSPCTSTPSGDVSPSSKQARPQSSTVPATIERPPGAPSSARIRFREFAEKSPIPSLTSYENCTKTSPSTDEMER